MKYIYIMLLTTSLFANNTSLLRELNNLTKNQQEVLIKSYKKGSYYDLGYTLAAIAWTESRLGKYKINLADGDRYKFKGSYGPYHNLLNSVCARRNIHTQWSASIIAQKLITDIDYASNEAIIELLYWDKYWTDKKVTYKWKHIVASYNSGYKSINTKPGREYLELIRSKIKVLKIYIKMHDIKTE